MQINAEKAVKRPRKALTAINDFKAKARKWMEENPQAPVEALKIYCKKLRDENKDEIPDWLLEATLEWFSYRKTLAKKRAPTEET